MGRHKTISDHDVLATARDVFRQRGHAASTREIARAVGVSEAVLYQRFGSKDALFFAAMAPTEPDVTALLGPADPPDGAHQYVRSVVERLADYFAGVLPIALQVMTHPSFDVGSMTGVATTIARVEDGLAARLRSLARRRRVGGAAPAVAARLLVTLAHDWALHHVLAPTRSPAWRRDLHALVDAAWLGLAPPRPTRPGAGGGG